MDLRLGRRRRDPRASTEPRPRGRGWCVKGGEAHIIPLLQRSPDLAVGDGSASELLWKKSTGLQRSPDLAVGDGDVLAAIKAGFRLLQRSPDLAVGDGAPENSGGRTYTYHFTFERDRRLDERRPGDRIGSRGLTAEDCDFVRRSRSRAGRQPRAPPRRSRAIRCVFGCQRALRVKRRWASALRLHTPSRGSRTPLRRAPRWGLRR